MEYTENYGQRYLLLQSLHGLLSPPAMTPEQANTILNLENEVAKNPKNTAAWVELGNGLFVTTLACLLTNTVLFFLPGLPCLWLPSALAWSFPRRMLTVLAVSVFSIVAVAVLLTLLLARMPPKDLPVASTSADAAEEAALVIVALIIASLSAVTVTLPPAVSMESSTVALTLTGFGMDLDASQIAQAIGFPIVIKAGSSAKERRRGGHRVVVDEGERDAEKAKAEALLRSRMLSRPETAPLAGAFDKIASAQQELASRAKEHVFRSRSSGSRLFGLAETLVRWGAETAKPNEKRYEEYRDSALESLRFETFSPAPVYFDLEETMLALALRTAQEELGGEHPFTKAALQGRSPEAVAAEAVRGTRLADPAYRKLLAEGGQAAIQASFDPLVALARRVDLSYREGRKWYEDRVQSVLALEGQKLARARFLLEGRSAYPDATFTLRLSYGKVAGYEEGTTRVPPKTTFHGLFDRSAGFSNKPPFDLPPRIAQAKTKLDLSTALDFVSTNDIIGGNSGSPVTGRDGRLVGLVFDGNIQSLVLDYAFSEEQARALAVDSAGMLEALRKVYGMDALADELLPAQP